MMMNVSPAMIAKVMALASVPQSLAELDAQVRHGLPKSALSHGVSQAARNHEEQRSLLYAIVPEATFKRRRDRLKPEESAKAERLARVLATALEVWDDADDAREFLHTPHPFLDGETPLQVSMTELGARRVEQLLWKLCYGLTA